MAGIRIEGSTSGNVAEVTTSNQIKVIQETNAASNPGNVGCVRMLGEIDAGTLTGTATLRSPKVTQAGRLRISPETLLFNETFNATIQNTSIWAYALVTMTMTLPGAGALQVGTVQGTAATHGAFLRTFQHFPIVAGSATICKTTWGLFTATLVANEEWRIGFGLPTVAGTAPTDGAWFVLDTAGLRGVFNYNSTLTQTAALATLASFTLGTYYSLKIAVNERGTVEFWRDDVLLGTLAIPAGNGQPFQNASLPIFFQKICTGVVANTNVIRVTDISAYLTDAMTNKDYEVQLSCMSQDGNLAQNGHATQGKNSIYANSTAPTAVALTNTTAAFTGLGGQAAVLPSLAVSSDGIIFSYQNPAPTINITGRNLIVYGVSIKGFVSVVFTGGPIYWQYCLAYGHTAVSLATGETASFATATTHMPRIVPLGIETYIVTAPIGTLGQGVSVQFKVPKVVRPGEFIAITAKSGVGSTVTSLGAITVMAAIDSVFE